MKARRLPLGIKNPIKTELPVLIALEAIGQPWFSEAHRTDLQAIALVSEILADEGSDIHIASSELLAYLDSGDLEVGRIRTLVWDISGWLQRQPNGRIQAAIDRLLGGLVRKAA
jgi:hypothetical protein